MYCDETKNYVILIDGAAVGITHSVKEAEGAVKAFKQRGNENVTFEEVKEIEPEEEYTHYLLIIPVDLNTSTIDESEEKVTFIKGKKTDEEFGHCAIEYMDAEKYELSKGNTIVKTFQKHEHEVTVSWSSKEKYDIKKYRGAALRKFASEMAKKYSGGKVNLTYDPNDPYGKDFLI